MLMTEPTPEMYEEWKRVWSKYKNILKPNRKTGKEIVEYLCSKYSLTELHEEKADNVVVENVLNNEPYAEKLPQGQKPSPRAFIVDNTGQGEELYKNQDEIFNGCDIFVGVDLSSGLYCIEGSSLLWDEVNAYQGLDEIDIQNPYCVAQYISCLKRFGMLESRLYGTC